MTRPPDPRAFRPRNIAVAVGELAVAWADGHESYYPVRELRRNCPCATCRAGRERSEPEGPLRVVGGTDPGAVSIARLVPVGSYGVQVVWSDGHDTGIHPYEDLRRACPCPACAATTS